MKAPKIEANMVEFDGTSPDFPQLSSFMLNFTGSKEKPFFFLSSAF